jgi:hypothetical protein
MDLNSHTNVQMAYVKEPKTSVSQKEYAHQVILNVLISDALFLQTSMIAVLH